VNVSRVELDRIGLRIRVLRPLCIHVHKWGTVWVSIPSGLLERQAASPEAERFNWWWTCRELNPRELLAREVRCPQHKPVYVGALAPLWTVSSSPYAPFPHVTAKLVGPLGIEPRPIA
jgi:hypothetical protein